MLTIIEFSPHYFAMEPWAQMLWVVFAGVAGASVPVAIKEHLTRRQRLIFAGVGIPR